jgi:hypothetical protein
MVGLWPANARGRAALVRAPYGRPTVATLREDGSEDLLMSVPGRAHAGDAAWGSSTLCNRAKTSVLMKPEFAASNGNQLPAFSRHFKITCRFSVQNYATHTQ